MPDARVQLPLELRPTLSAAQEAYAGWLEYRDMGCFDCEETDAYAARLSQTVEALIADALSAGVEPAPLRQALVSAFPDAVECGQINIAAHSAFSSLTPPTLSPASQGPTVQEAAEALSIDPELVELVDRVAPVVGQALRESSETDWTHVIPRLSAVEPDAVVVSAVRCYHGQGNKGWLVFTLQQMWWIQKSMLLSVEEPFYYDMDVSTARTNAVLSALSSGSLGMSLKSSCVAIGADQFQMTNSEEEFVVSVIRGMRALLDHMSQELDASPSSLAPVTAESPLDQLRGLAELRDLGIVTEAEFAQKKAEILSRSW